MSDHRLDTLDRDLAGAPSVSLDEAKSMLRRRWQSDGELRLPERPDEQGALLIRIPLFGTERWAYFEHGERARIVFLDRVEQPGAHASASRLPSPPEPRQSVAPRSSQAGDAGPLFGTPGCAAPACEPEPSAAPATLHLVCAKCGKAPAPGTIAIEGGTHYLVRHRNDLSRPKVDFKRTAMCGKWRRA